jgi:hypothetical protein
LAAVVFFADFVAGALAAGAFFATVFFAGFFFVPLGFAEVVGEVAEALAGTFRTAACFAATFFAGIFFAATFFAAFAGAFLGAAFGAGSFGPDAASDGDSESSKTALAFAFPFANAASARSTIFQSVFEVIQPLGEGFYLFVDFGRNLSTDPFGLLPRLVNQRGNHVARIFATYLAVFDQRFHQLFCLVLGHFAEGQTVLKEFFERVCVRHGATLLRNSKTRKANDRGCPFNVRAIPGRRQ